MATARIFQSGNSQAVRLPREFRFDANEVEIFKRGDEVVLRKPRNNASAIFNALAQLPSQVFEDDRKDQAPQEREGL